MKRGQSPGPETSTATPQMFTWEPQREQQQPDLEASLTKRQLKRR